MIVVFEEVGFALPIAFADFPLAVLKKRGACAAMAGSAKLRICASICATVAAVLARGSGI